MKGSTVSKVVEDTVMSAARSVAMERTILDVMKKREEVELRVYEMVDDALGKLGDDVSLQVVETIGREERGHRSPARRASPVSAGNHHSPREDLTNQDTDRTVARLPGGVRLHADL